MWASRPDMSRDECRKCLRCLELDAYGNMVSVLRAQGPFTDEKQKLLSELAKVLHISNERHRAEIRRAVNDDKLSVIAEQLNGPNTCTDWAIEGRRTIPLLPRLKAHTAFTGLANSLSMVIAAANEKKLPVPGKVEEPLVKSEMESLELTKNDERPVPKVPILHSETNARGKKRKRSLRESPDNDKCRAAQPTEPPFSHSETNTTPCKERRVMSPLPISSNQCPNVVQVSIVTPSSTPENTSVHADNSIEGLRPQLSCLPTNATYHHKINTALSTTTSSAETNSSAVQTSVNTHTIATATTNRQDIIPNVVATYSASAKSKTNVTTVQTKTNSKVQQQITAQCTGGNSLQSENRESLKESAKPGVELIATTDDGPKISRPDSTTSSSPVPKRITTTKICLTTKPVISSSTTRVLTTNSESTASSGPGPPSVKPPVTLTHKKLSPVKLNHHPGTKMGITLNTNKTLKINAHPNARLGAKANVIVVQKGSSRGVTLSHGGKEVLGKVIMGGKNLCLGSQKSGTSVALMPHRAVTNNGDQTLTMLSTVSSNHAESLKSSAKTGNMIVFDIRQDVLEKNKVLSQFLEASGVFNPESKTAAILNSNSTRLVMKNQNDSLTPVTKNAKSVEVVNNLTVESKKKVRMGSEPCLYSITEAVDSSDMTEASNDSKILTNSEERIETHGVLDAQTGIYNFESTGGTVIQDHVEDTIPTSGLDIFSTALASADINLENFNYVGEEHEEMVCESRDEALTTSPMSTVEPLNELIDS